MSPPKLWHSSSYCALLGLLSQLKSISQRAVHVIYVITPCMNLLFLQVWGSCMVLFLLRSMTCTSRRIIILGVHMH